ncbi:T9SS type A sorting domain-containing protein [Bacteroides nordii]|uniref:T9SS type A sorting domain-containing protein n=1 Tax=Bacteroides nordii TaxID=291645 RepID=UPI00399B8855
MNQKLIILLFTFIAYSLALAAQTNLHVGTQNRVVVFARFKDDPEIDTPRSYFDRIFNGENNSLKSYFKVISNGQLTINSYLYPANTGENTSFELKYCYYCYDNDWKGNYPNCKGKDITSASDINIGFIIKELAGKLEESENILEASMLDNDNDGYVDNFVIVLRGAGRGPGKGIYTPHVGTISEVFTKAQGPILLKGKTIRNYTVTFERNSLDTHCRFLLNYMGFPNAYPTQGSSPRFVGPWDPTDGPQLSYPLIYNRMKYSNNNWINSIPEIIQPGEYTLSPAHEATNNAYKISSSDPQQYWIVEYRDNGAAYENNLPEAGLLIYRVDTRYSGVAGKNTEIYLFRKDGTPNCPGEVTEAAFSDINGRTAFSSETNPYPFFTDGSTFNDLAIYDITLKNGLISFRINKVYTDIQESYMSGWNIHVASDSPRTLLLQGEGIEEVSIFDLSGRSLHSFNINNKKSIKLSDLASGVYIARLRNDVKEQMYKFILE